MFWDIDEIVWIGRDFRLLGRRGRQGSTLRVCDFRNQVGLYILHNDYGAYYVGLTRGQPLGVRLRQHFDDHHRGEWHKFSWFGFRRVRSLCHVDATQALVSLPRNLVTESREVIADVEALLIQALGTHGRGNRREERFGLAERWEQVLDHEKETYLERLGRSARRGSLPRENRAAFKAAIGRAAVR